MRNLILAMLLIFGSSLSHAWAGTAGELVGECDVNNMSYNNGRCHGMIEGVAMGLHHGAGLAAGTITSSPTWKEAVYEGYRAIQMCLPEAVTGDQVIAIVIKYLSANPEGHHLPAETQILAAMQNAFPCK